MNLDHHFPRYTDYDPAVPVWCVTPNVGRCMHRFFDTSPIDPTGRRLAVTRLPYEDKLPEPGDVAQVVVVDLESGEEAVVAVTRGWETQMGPNLNWADAHTLIFNDVEPGEWEPFAVRLDIRTGQSTRLGGPVYHVDPAGRYAASSCMKRMRWTQGGYGVVVPDAFVPTNHGVPDNDGLYLTDLASGEKKLRVSLRRFVDAAGPDELRTGGEGFQVHGFHVKWNPQGDRLIYTLRWFKRGSRTLRRDADPSEIRFAVYTLKPDGSDIHLAVPPECWEQRGHHINFHPDGRSLSMNLGHFGGGLKFVRCGLDGSGLAPILESPPGSGHPSLHPDGRHLLTDTYTHEPTSFGDGTVPLRWIDIRSGEETCLVRINAQQATEISTLRIDPHPAWDRTWRYVTFNGSLGGTRRVFIADMQPVLEDFSLQATP